VGTFGVEGYVNYLKQDLFATRIAGGVDTLSSVASGLSVYAQGFLVPKKLKYFLRYDRFNPTNALNNARYSQYVGHTPNYNDPSTRESLAIAGLDFMPMPNVHIMPNLWMNTYKNQGAVARYDSYDLVLRVTLFFVFGKG
jgi:hypothetical protein